MTTKVKAWPKWVDHPKPPGYPPQLFKNGCHLDRNDTAGVRSRLRKLLTQCDRGDDGVYRLSGTTFTMTFVSVEAEEGLWE